MKKRICLGLECNKEIDTGHFCGKCKIKNKRIKSKASYRKKDGSHYYRTEHP